LIFAFSLERVTEAAALRGIAAPQGGLGFFNLHAKKYLVGSFKVMSSHLYFSSFTSKVSLKLPFIILLYLLMVSGVQRGGANGAMAPGIQGRRASKE